MTVRGRNNHYNVKFLKGYGLGVSVKDSKIVLRDRHDPFAEPSIESWYVNKMPYEKIVLSGKGYISTDALRLLSENNRNVILLDTYGKPITYMHPVMESMTGTNYRIAQYDTFRDLDKKKYLIKHIVKAKVESQINFLKSLNNDLIQDEIKILDANYNSDYNYEHKTSKIYFKAFAKLIPNHFEFTSRNQHTLTITKRNATDVINALLNYGYAILAGEISKFVNGIGLDAYYGFYHKQHTGFQPLVYDLIEPFRWLVDYSVLKLAAVDNRQTIRKKDYSHTNEGIVVLDYNLIKRFLELLERTFQKERRYNFKHGRKTQDGLKSVHEITIAKILVQDIADFCVGRKDVL